MSGALLLALISVVSIADTLIALNFRRMADRGDVFSGAR